MTFVNYLRTLSILRFKKSLQLLPLGRHREYTPFIILCHGRTGSTLLHTYLNSHPAIVSSGEYAGDYIKKAKGEMETHYFKNHIFNAHPKPIKAVGLKFFFRYSDYARGETCIRELREMSSLKVIVLSRKNMIRTVISSLIADKTGALSYWGDKHQLDTKDKRLYVDTDECIRELKKMEEERNRFDEIFQNHQRLYLSYEELLSEKGLTLNKVQRFLNVKPRILFTLLKKQNPEPLSQLIINFNELEKALNDTPWQSMLYQP
ncbi:LPS sulfotransferase NodH [Catalinimonas alkaloidigena]|uniref:sulfotransferase n=1 Tax=Catalinimonas alkaloidigena TaxID=1075417 RepID=UPI0024067F3A|nr:sulfotransferase [Catalinimonas alkaloidigena]MDF9799827.1 LPS sulfotransferase NodH [Catalinimonas alkaloidigena]